MPEHLILREAKERNKFDSSSFVQKEIKRAFKEIMEKEYQLLSMYRPNELAINLKESLKEMAEKEKQSAVKIDLKRFQ
jgi:hypothetical protein